MSQRLALVTGAASGIGEAIARRLVRDGCHVVVVDKQSEAGKRVADQVGGTFLEADLTSRCNCRHVIEETVRSHQRVDILINNAGFQHIDPIEAFPEEIWEQMIAVMLTAPFVLTKHAWPAMKKNGWGRVVNLASVLGKAGTPYKAAYVSAKHGLVGLTKCAAFEGGPFGITVNAICPGYVRTPLMEGQIADQARTHQMKAKDVIEKVMLERTAVKRLIEPAEIADLVGYLCSDSASSITGATLSIDQGWTAS